ncbi:hypothetical protein AVEN_251028-1 [Araneus ventricosus]|uniref:Uncharacterized protein n=1 Tax=Araneus ventricosus TaxID=182803 RepID=A0A4Y2EJT6_ARAVE|nr:hypothetical protein AVEN_251028-1 [Araneus ventricosus]
MTECVLIIWYKRIPGCEGMETYEVDEWVVEDDSKEIRDHEMVETIMQSNADWIKDPEVDEVDDRVAADDGFRALEISLT